MKGKVVQVIGPVLDVEFPEGHLPRINNALKVTGEYESGGVKTKVNLTLEVAAHVGDNTVRTIALGPTRFSFPSQSKPQSIITFARRYDTSSDVCIRCLRVLVSISPRVPPRGPP